MSTIEARRTYTPQDLLALPDANAYELVDGELVERNVSVLASLVEGIVFNLLLVHIRSHQLGWIWPSSLGYQCFPDAPNKVRRPDVSFVGRERMTTAHLAEGHLSIPPDLAVEVLSPNDLAYEIDEKVEEYLRVGVRLVWVINPESRLVRVHRLDGSVTSLRAQDELGGEDVLPGFRCRVNDLFPSAA
jgi:Uma2 family endonuclease